MCNYQTLPVILLLLHFICWLLISPVINVLIIHDSARH